VLDMTNAQPAARRALPAPPARSAAEATMPTAHDKPWLAVMLDQVDHPMILLADDQTVLHANRAAQLELSATTPGHEHPLAWRDGKLSAVQRADAAELAEALIAARTRGIRKLLALGAKGNRVSVSVMAMPASEQDPHGAIMLVLGKRQVCGDLAVFWFARSHGLTQAECTVLQALCKGLGPNEIAKEHTVAISTVRTQLAAIRSKTGTTSLRDLVNEVACLPPLMHALGQAVTH
jgi:DNA-binding CsgD family transcriptional regulator